MNGLMKGFIFVGLFFLIIGLGSSSLSLGEDNFERGANIGRIIIPLLMIGIGFKIGWSKGKKYFKKEEVCG